MAMNERARRPSALTRARAALPAVLPVVGSVVLGIVAWQCVVTFADIPKYVLPAPAEVWHALVDGLGRDPTTRASYWFHLFDTLKATLFGFFIGGSIGLVAASLMAESRLVERAALPYVVGLQSLPKVAIAPLLVIWLGYGIESKIAMASVLTLFPVLINSLAGFRSVPRERLELMLALKATRWQIFRYVKVPGALPMMFAGLHIGIVYAMLGTIVSEFTGAQRGMGVIMTQLQTVSDTAGVFAALVVLSCTGYVLISLMRLLQRRIVFWAEESAQGAGV
jgi:NitT/TauT family transport system permease protein